MKKYIVSVNDNPGFVIVQTRADAEEYILSLAEEELYEGMLVDTWDGWSESPQAFIQAYADHYARIKKTYTHANWQYHRIYTTNGFMLYSAGINYYISEVEELD
jgi:hypothetical protein